MNKLQGPASYQLEILNSGNSKYFLDHKLFLKKILDESATLYVVYVCVYMTEQENVSANMPLVQNGYRQTFRLSLLSDSP